MSVTTSHVEDMLTDLKSFLTTNYGTYLTAIQTAKADGITNPAPDSEDIVLGAMDLAGYDDYPVVFLVPIGEEYEAVTMSRDSMKATITIWIVCGGFAAATLNKMIWRYAAEMRNVLRDGPTWGGKVDMSEVTEIAYFPVVAGEDELQAARVTVVAQREAA